MGAGRAMRAWIDRTKWSEWDARRRHQPAANKWGDFGTSRWAGSKVRLHQPRDWAEGGMAAYGTEQTSRRVRYLVANGG
jgi:hypothetical protein